MYIPGVYTSCNRPTQLGSLYCQGCSESHCSCDQRCCTGEDEDAMSLNIAQVPHEAVGTCEAVSISDFAERDCNGMRSETSGTFPLAEHITLWAAGLVAPQLPHSAMDVSHERIIDCRNARCPDCQGERFRVNCTRCGARYCWDCEYIELCSSTCTSFVATPTVVLANIGEDLLATIICMAFSFGDPFDPETRAIQSEFHSNDPIIDPCKNSNAILMCKLLCKSFCNVINKYACIKMKGQIGRYIKAKAAMVRAGWDDSQEPNSSNVRMCECGGLFVPTLASSCGRCDQMI